MAEKKTFKTVTESDVKSALAEAKKLRVEEGKALDAKRKEQEKDAKVVKEETK